MKPLLFILSLLFSLLSGAQSPMSYGEQRSRQDSDSVTMEARQIFNSLMRRKFAEEKRPLGLPYLSLHLNSRLVAQRARGAESAMEIVPQEMIGIMELINFAKRSPQNLLKDLKTYRTLRHLSATDLERVILTLGGTRALNLDYWGYLSKEKVLPKFNQSTKTLTFSCHWIERESRYELTSSRQRISLIIRGIHGSLHERAWYDLL